MFSMIRSVARVNSRCLTNFARVRQPNEEFYDVVINGAGLNGIATAISLAKSPAFRHRRILMVDKAPDSHVALAPSAGHKETASAAPEEGKTRAQWNSRCILINGSSMELINSWGEKAWERVEANGVGRVTQMIISDACSNSHLSLGGRYEPFSWIVETSNLLDVFNDILKSVCATNKVAIRRGTSVVDVGSDHTGSLLDLHLAGEVDKPIWTKLLVAADGFASPLREHLFFRKFFHDYKQLGICVALKYTEPDLANDGTIAYQRFLPTGPVGYLPLDRNHCSLTWTCDKPYAESLMALSDTDFVDTLNEAMTSDKLVNKPISNFVERIRNLTPNFLGSAKSFNPPKIEKVVSKRLAFPLRLMHAFPVTQHRVVLMGDAGHTLHPLAGLGLNLGLGDVLELRHVIEKAANAGADIGTPDQLAEYRAQRRRHTYPLAVATHFLNRTYAKTSAPLVALRSLGLTAYDMFPPVKKVALHMADNC